ncbi:methyltransferase cognate corrinoid protein [Desulfosporosinus orientis DSM 765]|uniref:Methyltransferase cognate corrinoid protein n=1 Tax=Desulfosporosinus orientis (strain ATCC 19365 / DSM 765 / NCIMB 8382 / VKM B-1628 / Singapore I) TaxID=768706 RepID=G7WAN6_DESOD|nr:methyltransferase cognate corrinoid protein [Desulfosporosinus orientis]AET66804.1 methyltransferase cognate corrinoid protein [Desulfosporosinus orientis DSM 765]
MSIEEIIQEARETILQCDQNRAVKIAERTLAEGYDPIEVISSGFSYGIRQMGELFGRGEVFLPQLILSSEVMKAAVQILDAAIIQTGSKQSKGTIVIATVEGDVHDIGKGIVVSLLKTQGIQVYDLGRDVSTATIIEKALEVKADIIGTSALLTTTLMSQKKLEDELRKNGLRDQFKTMVGGAPATQRWADRIGADAYAEDAAEAVTKALMLLKKV